MVCFLGGCLVCEFVDVVCFVCGEEVDLVGGKLWWYWNVDVVVDWFMGYSEIVVGIGVGDFRDVGKVIVDECNVG